ncbi:MAG: hypothetical protein QNJ97_10730 [Myxococcota bacterium]|nr:hypothetical protein [Myxococcota bacterium]
MKTIVIAGGGRRVGKTTLAWKIAKLLPDAKVVKLGTHAPRSDKPALLLPVDKSFSAVCRRVGNCAYLILESGSILDDPTFEPDLVLFLPATDGRLDKPGSERRRKRADIIRGDTCSAACVTDVSNRLDIDLDTAKSLVKATGTVPVEGDTT